MTQKEQRERDYQAQRFTDQEKARVAFKAGWNECLGYHAEQKRIEEARKGQSVCAHGNVEPLACKECK